MKALPYAMCAALLALAFYACPGCLSDGTVDRGALGRETELAAATLIDVATVYDAEKPELAAQLREVAVWATAAGQALQTQEGAEAATAIDAGLELAQKILAETDDPDVQAAVIVASAALRRLKLELERE